MPTARENLYEMATAAFKETGVPPRVHAAVTLMLDLHERDVAVRLAAKIRRAWDEHDPAKPGNVTMLSALNAAELIDPSEAL
ncbi:hypothetical protein AB0F20_05900 [Streptomyces goshikiensis]|uniref:hypothetical protein n=1 Tax=Streptomyces goshikiensis TaxID=1942 RepID=UPI0033C194AD